MTNDKRSLLDPPRGEGSKLAMDAVAFADVLLSAFDWREFLAEAQRFDTVGSMFEPTAWMRAQSNPHWAAQKRLAEAAASFVEAVASARDDLANEETVGGRS